MINEICKELKGSDAIYDFVDAVVVVRLKESLESCLQDLSRLGDNREEVNGYELEDYDCLLADVIALRRVIRLYKYEEEQTND